MAAAAIPTGFTGLFITARIITDVYHLFDHQTRHAGPSGSVLNGADHESILPKVMRATMTRTDRVPILQMRQIRGQRRKKRQKDSENRHVARAERSRARRSGFLLFRLSVRLFPFFLSFPIFSLFRFGQSVSLSLLVSLFLSSDYLPALFGGCQAEGYRSPTTR